MWPPSNFARSIVLNLYKQLHLNSTIFDTSDAKHEQFQCTEEPQETSVMTFLFALVRTSQRNERIQQSEDHKTNIILVPQTPT